MPVVLSVKPKYMQIDISQYPEKCHECGSPARTELGLQTSDDLHGVQWWQFCVNPKCIQFDANILRAEEIRKEATEMAIGLYKARQKQAWGDMKM